MSQYVIAKVCCAAPDETPRHRSERSEGDRKVDDDKGETDSNNTGKTDQTKERRDVSRTAETWRKDERHQNLSADGRSERTSEVQKNSPEENADNTRSNEVHDRKTDDNECYNDEDDVSNGYWKRDQTKEGHDDIVKRQQRDFPVDDRSSCLTSEAQRELKDENGDRDSTSLVANVAKLNGDMTEDGDVRVAYTGASRDQSPEHEGGSCGDEDNAVTPSVMPEGERCDIIGDGSARESSGDAENQFPANHDTSPPADLLYKEAARKVKERLNPVLEKPDDSDRDSVSNSLRFHTREEECDYFCLNCSPG